MPNFIYGDVTLADNKNDGGAVTTTAKVVATEWNTAVDALYDTKAAIAEGGEYYDLANQASDMPDVAASGHVRWSNNGGKMVLSRSTKDFWNPFTVLNVLEYGADPTGATDSTAAIQAAIAAMPRGINGHNGQILYFPVGDYNVTGTLDFSGMQGFTILGDGPYVSRLLWTGVAGLDFIYAMGSQLWGIKDLTLWGNVAAKPDSMVRSRMQAGYQFAVTGVQFENLIIDSDSVPGFQYGIRFDTDGTGNNSEVLYTNVQIKKANHDCVRLEGSQAKGHQFYACNMGQSEIGVHCYDPGSGVGAPAFGWFGGSMANCTIAGFQMDYPAAEPTIIDGVDMEHCFRAFTNGSTPTSAATPVNLRNSRFDCAATSPTPAFASFIQYQGIGPLIIENNTISGGSDGVTQIKLSNSGELTARIVSNYFKSANSFSSSPLVLNVTYPPDIDWGQGNVYADNTNLARRRIEVYDVTFPNPTKTLPNRVAGQLGAGDFLIGCDNTAWTAASTTQSYKAITLPRGVKIKAMYLYTPTNFILAASTLAFKVGSSSGGDEFILAQTVSSGAPSLFGGDAAHLGTHLTTDYVQGGYLTQSTYLNAQDIYFTMTSSSANLGNGSSSSVSAGVTFIVIETINEPRWLVGS